MKTRTRQRRLWLVNMLDGTWVVSCQRCGFVGRAPKRVANEIAELHVCR
jgi:hypothetical protein